MGGLGLFVCFYLVVVGVGIIGLVDFDVVELSNFQCQVVYGYSMFGMLKVEFVQCWMQDLNFYIEVVIYCYVIDVDNVQLLIQSYDLVLDGIDNFVICYLVNVVCVKFGKLFVFGVIYWFEGQVSVFNLEGGFCY